MAHDPNYIKWVQRSLNRLIGSGMVVNGEPNVGKYRQAVTEYKTSRAIVEPGLISDQIGRQCQNHIIYENMSVTDGGAYLGWLKKVLPGAPQNSTGMPKDFAKAVRDFQQSENGKPGPKLEVDGWVGPNTELRLIQSTKIEPPGSVTNDAPKPPIDPFTEWLNSMTPDKRYNFMMEIAAKRYAEGNWDPRIKELAQKLRYNHDLGKIPGQYFFEEAGLNRLVYGNPRVPAEQDPRTWLISKAKDGWLYKYYDLDDPEVQKIVQENFMQSANKWLVPYYSYRFGSRADYETKFQLLFDKIRVIHNEIDIGLGRIKFLRDKEHGDANAKLAQNLAKGLSKWDAHVYSAYRSQMPGEWWQYESPFPTGRKW